MPIPSTGGQPIAVLLVATWYPGVDDPGRGRFVADQAEALAATGRVAPLAVSFDVAYPDSDTGARHAGVVVDTVRAAVRSRPDVVSTRPFLDPRLPTARLSVPEPYGRASLPPGEEADARRKALELLVDRLDTGEMRGVVHAHTAYPDGYAAVGAARRLGWPLVITEHASFVARQLRQPEQRRRYLEAVEASVRFVAVSEMLAGELRASIPQLESKLIVVPNVIAVDAFSAVGPEERDPDELLYVGNRKERKGMVVLLRAFADILDERPTARLRLIGKSTTYEEEERWHRLADDLGITHAVRFDGLTDRAGIAAALRRASVFVHPSPRETFGVVTLEALASGVPVVATDSGGISHLLEDRRLGERVPAQDSRMLARAVLRTLERRAEFDPAVLRRAVEPFSPRAVGAHLADLYDGIACARTAGSSPSHGAVPWAGHASGGPTAVVAVASDADRAARALGRMPVELLRRITLVTLDQPTMETLPTSLAGVITARAHVQEDLHRRGMLGPRGGIGQRLRRAARDPIGRLRRRLARHGVREERWDAIAAGIRRAVEDVLDAASAGDRPEVVCLDVLDHAAVAPLIAARRAHATPGGLVWLADRWASAHAADPPPGDRPAPTAPSPPA